MTKAFYIITNGNWKNRICVSLKVSVQSSLVNQSCLTLCDAMDCSMPGLPVHCQFPEPTQTHVHRVGDAIQPSHPLSSSCPPAFNLSQHQGLFQGVSSSHQVAKVLEFQLQHQSFQWILIAVHSLKLRLPQGLWERPRGNVCSAAPVRLFMTLWPRAHQDPLSMGFSRQEYWSCHALLQGSSQPRD